MGGDTITQCKQCQEDMLMYMVKNGKQYFICKHCGKQGYEQK